MVDQAGYGDLLDFINIVFLVIAILSFWIIWRAAWNKPIKTAVTIFAGILFFGVPAARIYAFIEHKLRFNAAKAIFDERCKTAGEKVYETAKDVRGIYLVNVRRSGNASKMMDQ